MNGITGRMGYRQHLLRSILPIRDQGGVLLDDGSRVQVEPILLGRNGTRVRELAEQHGVQQWSTDQDALIADESVDVYFDAQVTSRRAVALKAAVAAGKHIYTEKPTAETLDQAVELAVLARDAGITAGVVHDKLYLPGLVKLRRLVDEGFFGRILSLRGEFGYWVFEGDVQPAQRPSWNYRSEDGGGVMVDMFCHWNYVLEGILGSVRAVTAKAVTHIPTRWDERGEPYPATADDAAYAIFELDGGIVAQINSSWAVRVYRDELVEFQVDGTLGSAVAGLNKCVAQQRVHTPMPVWNPDLPVTESFRDQWLEVPANADLDNGFKLQWEEFLRDVAYGRPHRFDLLSAARGVQLAEFGPAVLRRGPAARGSGDLPMTTIAADRDSAHHEPAAGRRPVPPAGGPTPVPTVACATPVSAAKPSGVTLLLPDRDGSPIVHRLGPVGPWTRPVAAITSRIAYAAAHVVPKSWSDTAPGAPAVLDWDATLAYRHELWSYGLGVADAMDTAQRGMGLDWAATRELIRRSGAEAAAVGGALACGAGTDQLDPAAVPAGTAGLRVIIDAYREQIDVVSTAGANVILMASRVLAAVARGPEDYLHVYGTLLDDVDRPVILHWLGTMFDAALAGYWGTADIPRATAVFAELIGMHAARIDGVKVSLLDAGHEVALRRELPAGVRLYTGDDFNYPELILGDGTHHSDALLGIFAAIYPAASTALQALDAGDPLRARQILDSTRDLGRHIFSAPTQFYKTGIAFLSWLNGQQPGFTMVGGLQSGRSLSHLVQTFILADRAGLLTDPELAVGRMRDLLAIHGWREQA